MAKRRGKQPPPSLSPNIPVNDIVESPSSAPAEITKFADVSLLLPLHLILKAENNRLTGWQYLEAEAEALSQKLNGLLTSRKDESKRRVFVREDINSQDDFKLSFDSAIYVNRDNDAPATFGPVYEVLLRRTEVLPLKM